MRLHHCTSVARHGFRLTAALALILAGCAGDSSRNAAPDLSFRADGILEFLRPDSTLITRIAIEIAESDSAQARGLMDRTSIPARAGMLFLYHDSGDRSFWMRSTPLPLDILFVREDGTVANIARRTVPFSDAHITSDGEVQNVLEVRAGFTAQWNIEPGTRIRWQRVQQSTDS